MESSQSFTPSYLFLSACLFIKYAENVFWEVRGTQGMCLGRYEVRRECVLGGTRYTGNVSWEVRGTQGMYFRRHELRLDRHIVLHCK